MMSDRFRNQWGVLMDQGYQGASDVLRAIIPKKKPVRGILSRADEEFNKKLSSNNIVVENYFGGLGNFGHLVRPNSYGLRVFMTPYLV